MPKSSIDSGSPCVDLSQDFQRLLAVLHQRRFGSQFKQRRVDAGFVQHAADHSPAVHELARRQVDRQAPVPGPGAARHAASHALRITRSPIGTIAVPDIQNEAVRHRSFDAKRNTSIAAGGRCR